MSTVIFDGATLAEITSSTAVSQSTDTLSADFSASKGAVAVRITIMEDVGAVWNFVPSAGTSYKINGGSALTADTPYTELCFLAPGVTWNLQTSTVGGVNITYMLIQALPASG